MKIKSTTDRVIKNNLRAWYNSTNPRQKRDGKAWYKQANQFTENLAERSGHDSYTIASVISALSPRNKWDRNLIDAEAVTWAQARGLSPDEVKVSTFNKNKYKAFRLLHHADSITEAAPKTHSFAMNVGKLSSDHVTIDSWHLRACQCKPRKAVKPKEVQESVTPKQYNRIKELTMEVAKEFNLKGYEFQAIVWIAIKEKTEA